MRHALPAVMVFCCAACGIVAPSEPVGVMQIIENSDAWDGKVVIIDGFLGDCEGYDCYILDNQHSNQPFSDKYALYVGFSEKFDAAAAPLQHKRVLLIAKINALEILIPGTDRSEQLIPLEISAWRPSGKNPKKGD